MVNGDNYGYEEKIREGVRELVGKLSPEEMKALAKLIFGLCGFYQIVHTDTLREFERIIDEVINEGS